MFFPVVELDINIELIIGDIEPSCLWKLEAYNKGYERGLTWPDDWGNSSPGGPWVDLDNPISGEENRLWCLGWHYGNRERLNGG